MEQLISTDNVAKFLGISRPTVVKYIQQGRLEACRSGRAYKIARPALESFARQTGVSEDRLDSLEEFLRKNDKSTQALNLFRDETSQESSNEAFYEQSQLVRHDPPNLIVGEENVCYYLALRTHPEAHEIICRVGAEKFYIGRHSQASLSIQDPFISSMHATLHFQSGLVRLMDQSTNGTLIRDAKLSGSMVNLGDGDQFLLGHSLVTIISPQRIDLYLTQRHSST